MAVMTLLLAAEDVGLGALFFGVFDGEAELRATLGIPDASGAARGDRPRLPVPTATSGRHVRRDGVADAPTRSSTAAVGEHAVT